MDRIHAIQFASRRITLPRRGKVPLALAQQVGPTEVQALLVRVTTDSNRSGVGFAAHFGPGSGAIEELIEVELSPLLRQEAASHTDRLWAKAEHHLRETGLVGLAAKAYGLIDVALWDLKAQAAGVVLAEYLGAAKPTVAFFQTETPSPVWDAADVAKATKTLMKAGGIGVRVRVGSGDVQADADRIRELRDALGEDAWLGVNAGSAYDLNTALALAHFFEDQGVDWFEDPIPLADDLGYAKLAARVEIPLAVGSSIYRVEDYLRIIRSGNVRLIRPDVIALGGLTPTLQLAQVAQAYHVAVSPNCSMELGVHLGCGLASVPHIDARSWIAECFDEVPAVAEGKIKPLHQPGLGLSWSDKE